MIIPVVVAAGGVWQQRRRPDNLTRICTSGMAVAGHMPWRLTPG